MNLIKWFKNKYHLEIVIFFTSAVIMIFELVGSRILSPYVGTSLFVWSSIIGIILINISIGNYLGGRFSDKNPSNSFLSQIIFLSSVSLFITYITKDIFLDYFQKNISDIKILSIVSSIFLFSLTSIFLGIVSPYIAKLKIQNKKKSGTIIGGIYAISTLGSIFGTFFAGFYLIPKLGTNNLLFILIFILLFISHFLSTKKNIYIKLIYFLILFFYLYFYNINKKHNQNILDIDSSYGRIIVKDLYDNKNQKNIRNLIINIDKNSGMFLENDELLFEYTKYYHLIRHFNPNFQKVLMIGGGGYSFPKDYLNKYTDSSIDVVEIDPMVTKVAKDYFRLKENIRLNIYHDDARVFLNKTKNKYDAILGDAFGSHYSIPYQLTTIETVKKKYEILNENGVVILNIISSLDGNNSRFLKTEYKTYKKIFPKVLLIPVFDKNNKHLIQNIMLIALKSNNEYIKNSNDTNINYYLSNILDYELETSLPILTDDYAPVDFYTSQY